MNTTKTTIKINWEQPCAGTRYIPLHKAIALIIDINGNILKDDKNLPYFKKENGIVIKDINGVPQQDWDGNELIGLPINNGEIIFDNPKKYDNFRVRVYAQHYDGEFQVMAEHGGTSHFVTAFTDEVPKDFLGPAYEIKNINNTYELNILISTEYQISSEPWSVFQALVDLTRIAKEQLGFTPKGKALNRKIYLNESKTQYLIPKGKETDHEIHFKKEGAYNWDTIAHEFSHAILIETGAIIPQTGDHTTDKNLYDYGKELTVYKNKEAACALAFGEGAATWLAISLLKYSNYKYEKGTDGKYKGIEIVGDSIDAQIVKIYGHGIVVHGTDRNLDLDYETGLINCYGEDAELAVSKLLWRVTNDIPLSGTSYKINKLIHLNKLFNNVFLDGKGKGRALKNIKDFYHALFNYYVKTTPELVGGQYWHSSRFEENFGNDGDKKTYDQMDNIEKLAELFSTFGMAPAIEPNNFELTKNDGNIGDSITWYDRSTGTMPRDETFDIYLCFSNSSLSHRAQIKRTVSYQEKNGQRVYKYILTDADKAYITNSYAHSSPGLVEEMFFTFMVRTSTETGSYFSNQVWVYVDWWWAEMLPYNHLCDITCR